MKFKNKEDLMNHYNTLYKNREGYLLEWMQITWHEFKMYQLEKEKFKDFMFDKHKEFDDYNKHIVNKRNEYRKLKSGDTIKCISEEYKSFTKNKEYKVGNPKKGFAEDKVWISDDVEKYGYITEDDYIYDFELVFKDR